MSKPMDFHQIKQAQTHFESNKGGQEHFVSQDYNQSLSDAVKLKQIMQTQSDAELRKKMRVDRVKGMNFASTYTQKDSLSGVIEDPR